MLEIYGAIYNVQNGLFNWQEALTNFSDFADSITISTTIDCKDDSVQILTNYIKNCPKIKLVVTDIKFEDLDFDGRLKDAALKECKEPFCMLLDADERCRVKDKDKYLDIINGLNLERYKDFDAIFIPVIDLFNTEKEYKSVGQKWYIHRNKPNIGRGIVNFAKLYNGKINHTQSDTCELVYRDAGDLVKATYLVHPGFSEDVKMETIKKNNNPVIYHLGWLDKQKRIGQSSFWEGIWSNRAGFKVDVIKTEEELNKIPYWEHGLPLWYE